MKKILPILLALLFLLPLISAATVNDVWFTGGAAGSPGIRSVGGEIQPNYDLGTLLFYNKAGTNVSGVTLGIFAANLSLLTNVSVTYNNSANQYYFNVTGIRFNQSQKYGVILFNVTGNIVTQFLASSSSVVGTNLNYSRGSYYSNSANTYALYTNTQIWGFESITSSNYSTASSGVNISATLTSFYAGTSISNFTLTASNGTFVWNGTTTNGTVILGLLSNSTSLWTFNFSSNQSFGFFNRTYTNINVSSVSVAGSLYSTFLVGANFSGNFSYGSGQASLVRNLTYAVGINDCYENGTLRGLVNGSNLFNTSFVCNYPQNITVNGTYAFPAEQNYSLTFDVVSTYNYTTRTGNTFTNASRVWNFTSDLYAPSIFVTSAYTSNFTTNLTANFTLRCVDTWSVLNLSGNLTLNNVSIISNTSFPNNTTLNATALLIDGTNTLLGICADLFSSNTSVSTFTTFAKSFFIINEITGAPFNLSNVNVTYVRLWFGDNSSYFDFKTANVTNISVRSNNVTNFRLEVGYVAATPIVSYLNILYVPEANISLCAKDPGVLTYQQLIISTTNQFAALKNAFTNCYVAADITQFAYQDAFLLQAITANSKYYLYTYDNGAQVYLAAVDGSIATYINLETIIFSSQQSTASIIGDGFTASKTANNTFTIRYANLANNIDNGTLTITRMDNTTVVSIISSFSDPDNWTLVFNYASLANVTNSTVFKVQYDYDIGGTVYSRVIYLSPVSTAPGRIPSGFAFGLSLMILAFGLTITSVRITFGWFGILIVLGAIIVAALGTSIWYLNFLMAMEVIALVFMVIYLSRVNWQQVV